MPVPLDAVTKQMDKTRTAIESFREADTASVEARDVARKELAKLHEVIGETDAI